MGDDNLKFTNIKELQDHIQKELDKQMIDVIEEFNRKFLGIPRLNDIFDAMEEILDRDGQVYCFDKLGEHLCNSGQYEIRINKEDGIVYTYKDDKLVYKEGERLEIPDKFELTEEYMKNRDPKELEQMINGIKNKDEMRTKDLNIHEIYVALKQLPKYAMAKMNNKDQTLVMLDRDDNLKVVYSECTEDDLKKCYDDYIGYDLFIELNQLYVLNATFDIIEPKEEEWIECKNAIDAIKWLGQEKDRTIKSINNKKETIYKYGESISPYDIINGKWYYKNK